MEPQNSIQAQLLERYIQGSASQAEVEQLFTWLREHEPESIVGLNELLESSYTQAFAQPDHLDNNSSNRILEELLRRINNKSGEISGAFTPHKGRRIRWYWVAASIIMLLGIGTYFYVQNAKQETPIAVNILKDIPAPATHRAMITLADGSQVFLDSVDSGQLAQLGNIKLVKLSNGQIAYQTVTGEVLKEMQYNTLTNPKGSKVIDMQLSDGSHVWLNAGSSITYPIAFIGNERKVELMGEGYFEVAKDPAKKFVVTANGSITEVLGTHFNVNAYADEKDTKVTLLEGSVKVSKGDINAIVRPGQQAQVTNDVKIVNDIDPEAVMAWKNEYFQFEGVGIEDVMRQISRWYDVEVIYEVQPRQAHFRGRISRAVEASKVFKMLETTQAVHFRIEGRKVYIIR
ncbi:MAG TPA: FecR domain-containing protein [Niabella sp.]|nr:FecR domain-containing protein [Niabella sp.]